MQTQWYLCEIENYSERQGNILKKLITYPLSILIFCVRMTPQLRTTKKVKDFGMYGYP